jgi:hypothetical protein
MCSLGGMESERVLECDVDWGELGDGEAAARADTL